MGGPINGGRVFGDWPGIEEHELHEGRDLAVTTDFRTVVGSVLAQHLMLGTAVLPAVFPNSQAALANKMSLIRT
jgi:uncharacterized protein (DUF1501 family)